MYYLYFKINHVYILNIEIYISKFMSYKLIIIIYFKIYKLFLLKKYKLIYIIIINNNLTRFTSK